MARTGRSVVAALIVIAIVSRVGAVWVLQSHRVPRSTFEHGEIASNLLAGRGFSIKFLGADGPTSQQAPVYPAIVAIAYALGGVGTARSLFLLEFGQSILGGLLVLGVVRLCRFVAPARPRMGWIAGLVVAIHPPLVYAATHVQVATLGATLLTWTLAWAYQTGAGAKTRDAVITGVLLGLLALSDPILAISAVGVIWAICQAGSGLAGHLRRALGLVAVVGSVGLMTITPWLVRNALIHGEFVAIKSTFGYAFWQGNCALSAGTDKVVRPSVERILDRDPPGTKLSGLNQRLWEARHEAGYLDDIALSSDDYRLLGSVSEPERSRILLRRALADLTADPVRYARLCLRRLRFFIFFDETNPKTRVLAYRVPHLILTGFAVIGFMLATPSVRRKLVPTAAVVALIALFHTFTIVSARFHIPIEPLLAVWGAAGLARYRIPTAESSAAGNHVKRVRLVDRLAVVHGNARFRVLGRPAMHEC